MVKQSMGWPWWAAIIVGFCRVRRSGLARNDHHPIGLPSFVVTCRPARWLAVMLMLLGSGGALPINVNVINDVASGNLTPVASWIV